MGAEVDRTQLASLLSGLKNLPPKIRTETRRDLRGVGDGVIAKQREILSGPLPAGVAKVGQRNRLELNKKTGKFRVVKRNVYGDAERKNAQRSTGMREARCCPRRNCEHRPSKLLTLGHWMCTTVAWACCPCSMRPVLGWRLPCWSQGVLV